PALAGRVRGRVVRGARATRPGTTPHRAVLSRRVLPPAAGRAQRVGRLAHGAWGRAGARRERAVAPRARPALVEHGRRRGAGARRAVRRELLRAAHRTAGETRRGR